MANITINTNNIIGKIKRMHATGQPPFGGIGKKCFHHFHYLTEIGVPYSRLHDVSGAFGGNRFVDIPCIFRDWNADENLPDSYDFTFTDALIKALFDAGVEPYYRLGVTIENQAEIKSYHIDPPKDYEKWARICEHIIAHYTCGWADGFQYDIKYWEIWNEVDDISREGVRVSQMWSGTPEDYYRLYDVTAKHLKKCFPNIKVGGYAATGFYAVTEKCEPGDRKLGFIDFFHGFMKYISEHDSPIDFFSYHSYNPTASVIKQSKWLVEQLRSYGYGDVEVHLNEWNPFPGEKGTGHHGAEVEATMLGLQNVDGIDMLMIYDARLFGRYAALFNSETMLPNQAYYALCAFNHLYQLGDQAELMCDTEELYSVCATNGSKSCLVISNLTGNNQKLNISGVSLENARYHVIDDLRLLSWSPAVSEIENNSVLLIEFDN